MKIYKLTVCVLGHEVDGKEAAEILENTKYPNWCMCPSVVEIEEREIGEWDDDHPLNQKGADLLSVFRD